eukprot:5744364-Heterocapsa_arctica.AAC.1
MRQLKEQGPPRLCELEGEVSCGIVDSYKHLGSIKTQNGSPLQDSKARSRAMMKTYAQLAHR